MFDAIMSNLSQRFAWLEFDIKMFSFLLTFFYIYIYTVYIITQLEVQQTTAQTYACTCTSLLWGLCHMTVGTGALWDVCLFSAVNRSHEVIGA